MTPLNNYRYQDGLESDRLISRFLEAGDAATWAEFFTDKKAIELFPASFLPPGEDHAATWINRQLQRYGEHNFGLQALISKGTGEFLGLCGLISQEVDGKREVEVGYHILKRHWGYGYAPEAAKLFIDFAFAHNVAPSVISIIDVRNTNSQRVAEKNGLSIDRQTAWNGLDVYIYRIHKP